MSLKDDINRWFEYEKLNGMQIDCCREIRDTGRLFAMVILKNTPECPDQTVAIRKIREAVMTVNAAVAYDE